eukprot:GSA25T00009597001.1
MVVASKMNKNKSPSSCGDVFASANQGTITGGLLDPARNGGQRQVQEQGLEERGKPAKAILDKNLKPKLLRDLVDTMLERWTLEDELLPHE